MQISDTHFVNGNQLKAPFPDNLQQAIFGFGCFWGAERKFWEMDGVFSTAVGYAGGELPDPDYKAVCTGNTGHAEVVLVVYDPTIVSYDELLKAFWEGHNPTQGFRQGNDIGSQYRSVIFAASDAQASAASRSRDSYEQQLMLCGHDRISTDIGMAPPFFYAEDNHQQYLAKHPRGYCGLSGTNVKCDLDSTELTDA